MRILLKVLIILLVLAFSGSTFVIAAQYRQDLDTSEECAVSKMVRLSLALATGETPPSILLSWFKSFTRSEASPAIPHAPSTSDINRAPPA